MAGQLGTQDPRETRVLREGFTTGSAATGAALAALRLLLDGERLTEVAVPLPPFDSEGQPRGWRTLPIAHCATGVAPCEEQNPPAAADKAATALADGPAVAHATIIKDGGDDPDVTNGLPVVVSVTLYAGTPTARPEIALHGGPGVGRVTLPGLPVPVGEVAINPVPREQIRRAIWLWLGRNHALCPPLRVTVSVPGGEAVAGKTFNPRLGIVGGISILGTQGTVRPYSHDAFKATIAQGLQVAHTMHCDCVCLTTGRRSEKLLMALFPALAAHAFVQVADFAQFALHTAGEYGFGRIVWGCFFGKLIKLAQGLPNTHAHEAVTDMRLLASLCREHGLGSSCVEAMAQVTTAAHALELVLGEAGGMAVITALARRVAGVASQFAGQEVRVYLFHTDGRLLCGPVGA